jgi:hypothetical protein
MLREEKMDKRTHPNNVTPRRGFFTRIAASAVAIGFAGLGSAPARAAAGADGGPDWPGELKGRHRQVVDAYAPNDGFPLAFAFTFVVTNGPASAGVVPASAVVVLRHTAFPLALDHPMWEKYKIGQSLSILDPETKAPAVKNPFLQPKPGVLTVDDMPVARTFGSGQPSFIAPYAGVRIETLLLLWPIPSVIIAPYAGVRIETMRRRH